MDKKQQKSQYSGILFLVIATKIIPKTYLYAKLALFVYKKDGFVHFQVYALLLAESSHFYVRMMLDG